MMKKPEMSIVRKYNGEDLTIYLTLDELFRAYQKIQLWSDMSEVEMRYGESLTPTEIEAVACRMRTNINRDDDAYLYSMDSAVYELGYEERAYA